jgi:hypothetical protein
MILVKFHFQLIFLIILYFLNSSISIIISKSNIEMCTQNSQDNTTSNSNTLNSLNSLNCTEKLVLTLSIENGKMSETDYIEVFISEVNTQDGSKRQIQNPYKISISKTPVYAEYPCIYLQDFNYKPREQIIISDVFSCNDGDLASNPTCGWVKDSTNKIVPYSQGFCCKCDFSQIIGIDTTSRNRGSSCGFLNLGSGSATAHCLRFDSLWYSAYEIKKYRINYLIEISVTYKNENNISSFEISSKNISSNNSNNFTQEKINNTNQNFITEKISLSPSNTISMSSEKNIIARLIGDFQPPTPPNDYSIYYLVTPSYPESHSMVLEGPINWMIIPRNYFTLDGRDCDKIGVSYFAFRSQGGASTGCNLKVGECLHNQIYDYYIEDIQRLSAGKNVKYLMSQDKSTKYDFFSESKETKKFAYKLEGVFNSLINLEINADDIKYVTNVSTGQIDYLNINTFESLSNDGYLEMQITNSGSLTAQFSVSYNCSEYILPLLSDQMSLNSFQSTIIKKDIYTLSQDSRNHICNATLLNAIGEKVDLKSSRFNTTVTQIINIQNPNMSQVIPSSNDTNNILTNPVDEQYIELDCKVLCPEFFDYICFIAHGCWGYFARTTGIILIVVVLGLACLRMIKNGSICKYIDKIALWLAGGKESHDRIKNYDKKFQQRI